MISEYIIKNHSSIKQEKGKGKFHFKIIFKAISIRKDMSEKDTVNYTSKIVLVSFK